MKVYLRDQRHRLSSFLPEFRQLPLSFTETTGLRTKTSRLAINLTPPPPDLDKCDLDFLFDYRIFPARILVHAADWEHEGRRMRPGDVIVQQSFLPPLPISLKCIFAVRIVEVFRSPDRAGFRYGTLIGHVEKGESSFYFERSENGFHAVIHTQSRPALLVSRLAAPVFTYPYQQYCANQALLKMRTGFLAAN